MSKLDSEHAVAVDAIINRKKPVAVNIGRRSKPVPLRRVVVTVDVEELHCPIELEVGAVSGALLFSHPDLTLRY